jgi:capsular polysaccharide biosynthesis protein
LSVGDVYRTLWRYKTLIVLLTALCVGATWYLTSREVKTYQARTLVRIQQRFSGTGDPANALDASQRLTQTYAQIIDSGALTRRITAAAAAVERSGRISSLRISADPVPDTDLMWIAARSRDPHHAAAGAGAAPRALRSFMRETGRLNEQVIRVKAATVPTSPASPQLKLNVALALVLGLIFNGALALLIELIRDRLPEPEELGASLGYPVLATIPLLYRSSGPTSETTQGRAAERPASSSDRAG